MTEDHDTKRLMERDELMSNAGASASLTDRGSLGVEDDRSLMLWAGEAVKKPWFKMVEVGESVIEGRPGSAADRRLEIPLFPIPVDGKVVVWFLQEFLTTLLTDNGSMHTIILNRDGNRIIWSCIEAVHKGTYAEIHESGSKELDELNKKVTPFIVKNKMERAFNTCKKFAKTHYRINLGIVKVAHLQFFEEFKKVYEFSQDGQLLINHIAGCLGAITNIFRNHWLRFYPEARVFNLLGKMITRGALDILPEDIQSLLGSLLPPMRIGVGLHSKEWGVLIEFEAREDGDLSIRILDADSSQSCWHSSLQRFSDNIRRKLGTKVALAVKTDELLKVFKSLMDLGVKYNRDNFASLIATLGRMFPKYGESFAVSPKPNLYKRRYKWAYGIDLTREIKVPATAIVRGIPLFIGSSGAFALGVTDDHNKLLTLLHIQMRGPLLASIKSLDKHRYQPIVTEATRKYRKTKLMQATKALKFAITEDTEQWLNYAILLEKSTLSKTLAGLVDFIGHMFWTSLLRPGEFKRFIRTYMSREALTNLFEEKLTVYPSNPIFKLIEEKGIWTFRWPL